MLPKPRLRLSAAAGVSCFSGRRRVVVVVCLPITGTVFDLTRLHLRARRRSGAV